MNHSEGEPPGCLGAIFRLFFPIGRQQSALPQSSEHTANSEAELPVAGPLPYRVRDDFLSPAELSFYRVLSSVLGERAILCPKVGLSDLFFVTQPHLNLSYRARIAQKHVDFVLCDATTLQPLAGIELDDQSHTRADRQERDAFVEQVFEAAQLPLLRIPVRAGYRAGELEALIAPLLRGERIQDNSADLLASPEEITAPTVPTGAVPTCPRCGIPMVLRQASRGPNAGESFYGCANYPRCRQTKSASVEGA